MLKVRWLLIRLYTGNHNIVQFQKISIHTPWKGIGNPERGGGGGGEVSEAKIFKEKYGVKLEFLEGWGEGD